MRRNRRGSSLLLYIVGALCFLLLSGSSVRAATKYVATAASSPAGSDAAAGTIAAPWLTLNYALSHVACGDTILLRAGSFPAAINTQTTPATSCLSWALAVTMKAYPGEVVHLPSMLIAVEKYLIFEDLFLDGVFGGQGETVSIAGGQPEGTGAGHIRFVNVDFHGNNTTPAAPGGYAGANGGMLNSSIVSLSAGGTGYNEFIGGRAHDIAYPYPAYLIDGYNDGSHGRPGTPHCFYIESPNNLIDGVEIDRCANYAIHNIYSASRNNIYRNNYIHHTGTPNQTGFALLMSTGSNNVAYNNIIVWNANGVDISEPGQKLYNNTIAFNGLNGSCGSGTYIACYAAVQVNASGTGVEVKNNIIYGNYSDSISDAVGLGAAKTPNLFTNPSFTNPSGAYAAPEDFQLQISSNAKDTGVSLAGTVTTDYNGVSRPQGGTYDHGAWEFLADDDPVGCSSGTDAYAGTGVPGLTWTQQNNAAGATATRTGGALSVTTTDLDIAYFCNGVSLNANQYSQFTVGSGLNSVNQLAATVRASGTTSTTFNFYGGYVTSTEWFIYRVINGGSQLLSNGSTSVAQGANIRLTVVGTLLTLAKNGVTLGIATDTLLTSGNPGVAYYASSAEELTSWVGANQDSEIIFDTTPGGGNRLRTRKR